MRGGRTWLVGPNGASSATGASVNRALVRTLKAAHAVMRETALRPDAKIEQIVKATAPAHAYDRKLCRLGFLAPDIQRANVDGRQPRMLTLEQLTREDLPLCWAEQRRVLGF